MKKILKLMESLNKERCSSKAFKLMESLSHRKACMMILGYESLWHCVIDKFFVNFKLSFCILNNPLNISFI